MKTLIGRMAAIYFGILFLFSGIFLFLFHSPLFVRQHVLFYRGTLLLGVTIIVVFIIAVLFGKPLWKTYSQTLIVAILMAASIHLSIFVVFPVTFERSVTMFTLETLAAEKGNVCGGLSKNAMQEKLIQGYVIGRDAMAKRIEEQSIIHMIEKNTDCYMVTERATKFLEFSRIVKSVYNIR